MIASSYRRVCALLIALALPLIADRAEAQFLVRPHLEWRTIETQHFRIHFPASLEPWTRTLAERIESVHASVTAVVGSAPAARIDVVVDDPYNLANGMAVASIGSPVLYLWPTPPEPGFGLSDHRGWSELLAVHEYAHLAHLTRPSRNPWQRLLWRVLPENVGPIARRAPRWVTEGYATYIEGQLTGRGRPHGVFRPAVIRQFALEGRLPTYAELGASKAFLGGSMAYLTGSAYLEWLVARSGEQSLRDLWRRMTARADRGFVEAFRGVYGATPEELYRLFTVEATGEALRIRDALQAVGVVDGETVVARRWATGRPTVSADGQHLAVALPERDGPGRLVVLSTEPDTVPERVVRARARMLERDPQDVPAIDTGPRPRRVLATLRPRAGRAHADPQFFADGERILLTCPEPLPDGTLRPDLFVWSWREGAIRRVTHGAALRSPSPSPDGREAVAVQCDAGACAVVIVDMESGAVETLVEGSPFVTYVRPRFSPDGRRIVVAVQERGPWRLAIIDRATGRVADVPNAGSASRYDATFTADGESLIAISERGGIPNVVRVSLATGEERPLTRVLGAALAPDVGGGDSSVYFLRLQGDGLDVARVPVDTVVGEAVDLDPAQFPAAPREPGTSPDTFDVAPVPPSRAYGLGPRKHRFLPSATGGDGWFSVGAAIVGTDPVGRLSWTLQGAYTDEGGWRGGALSTEYRRWRPWLTADAFHVQHEPSRDRDAISGVEGLDASYSAGVAGLRMIRQGSWRQDRLQLGASGGRLSMADADSTRVLAFGEIAVVARAGAVNTLSASIDVHGSRGRTGNADWTRGMLAAAVSVSREGNGLSLDVRGGTVSRDAPPFEQFVLGGEAAALVPGPVLAQRIAIPAMPFGARGGDRFAVARASLTGSGFQPYYLLANVGDFSGRWNRVIGAEQDVSTDAIPLLRLPAVRAIAGIGYSLDEPARRDWRVYVSAVIRP